MTTETTATPTQPKTRPRKPRSIAIAPIFVSPEVAADMLDIGERTLDRITAEGKLHRRQISKGRTGYLVAELQEFAAGLPKVGAREEA